MDVGSPLCGHHPMNIPQLQLWNEIRREDLATSHGNCYYPHHGFEVLLTEQLNPQKLSRKAHMLIEAPLVQLLYVYKYIRDATVLSWPLFQELYMFPAFTTPIIRSTLLHRQPLV
jgi:hypothetical protein